MKRWKKTSLYLALFGAIFYFLRAGASAQNHIIINEILIGTSDSAKMEFIEIYNPTSETIDLSGFSLKKKTKGGTESNLVSNSKFIGSIGPQEYFVISHPDYQNDFNADLAYSGTSYSISDHNTILFYNNAEELIDKAGYGEATDYENYPAINPDTGISIGRINFIDSNNNSDDFVVLDSVSPGSQNTEMSHEPPLAGDETSKEQEKTGQTNAQTQIDPDLEVFDFSQDIILSEIFPNPVGLDQDSEWIEIYNRGTRTINLYGWQMGDESGTRYTFPKQTIKAREYLVVEKKNSGISLNNKEDTVFIWQPFKDEFLQRIKYEKAGEGESYNYLDYKWTWNNNPTPGEKNKFEYKNTPPNVDFYFSEAMRVGTPICFDGSDTSDKDGDALRFFWDFGDGFTNNLPNPEHTFWREGEFEIKLLVSDGIGTSSAVKKIQIGRQEKGDDVLGWADQYTPVVINEILPDPNGKDTENEFIELYNNGEGDVNLRGWILDDEEGGSAPYKFTEDTWLGSDQYFVVFRPVSKLALNNDIDTVRLFKNEKELVEEIKYENVVPNNSYARGLNNRWFWTEEATPEEENSIQFSEEFENDNLVFLKSGNNEKEIPFVLISEIGNYNISDKLRVSGIVAVEPGVLGAQYFYITEQNGIQVYNYRRDFPDLKAGNIIEVTGELSVIGDEYRIKTKTKDDIIIIDKIPAPQPIDIDCGDIDIKMIGSLVLIRGEVIERKGCSVFLDDGSDEIKVYIKESTGIDFKSIKAGDWLSVIGIVSSTNTGIRILPRTPEDIEKQEIIVKSAENEVIGEVPAQKEWSIEGREKTEWYKYALVVSGFIFITIGFGYLKFKK
ncbi:hypothetical protein A2331_04755 [Candidatus Falkowbacteria bacterium RIFOXYB2_FULL_34_18]|uniref:PKD domain-containing protein n=1 Tax=Candidatus Falkowbacteria bacterium RIFOXYD2_FULL_34_120 TaxID=1798007 RepID=A0A1F5TPY8_9BACT|nr:MAG: hypothetical protein A2331_04755 [Candidatus Falkowbacteria bacterium RIFOXYB2_FULL_34_18]OGF29371.1 MAG: hypothetical protein A2500_06340 [Candidatus Falkowbacteria bacterium RIFOXYC12_FULL_34_55]OGF36562.1 MAG: hypothetical protein A2466_07380 [Candidatus Falkowbacteria bacterium RIFOXYC2_FULL_34_220]OGF38794.1 MAG: hypothetical protein A2515_03490 [Candidatus Falkowbacteria bacterium RIFOXYD12_FULL_34_57]OGF41035.1 MAG: hypothetical protein A2531_03735 [Candidatus Falkowbacteria bact